MSNIEKKGLIFNFQRFSIHDGPGIRTVVFLKGCPLNCKWCSNPEAFLNNTQINYSSAKCINCNTCVGACRVDAIKNVNNMIEIDWDMCVNCLECSETCSTQAISKIGQFYTVEEVIEKVKRDAHFYKKSHGGVTISGGEPVMQPEFLRNLIPEIRKYGFNVAIETTGYVNWNIFYDAVKEADLLLFDLKSIDNDTHLKYTGVENRTILDNYKKIIKLKDVVTRLPLIPGINTNEKDLNNLANFISENNPNGVVHLLGYHSLGKAKYNQLGLIYDLAEIKSPSEYDMKNWAEAFKNKGLIVELL